MFARSPGFSRIRLPIACCGLGLALLSAPLPAAELPPWSGWLAAARQEGYLPLAFATQVAEGLRVSVHHDAGDRLAYLVPLAAASTVPEAEAPPPSGPDRATLFLYQPAYLRDNAWVPLPELPVDATEQLFSALAGDYLAAQLQDPASPLGAQLRGRSQELFASLPAEHREEAYLTAAGDFVAHVLSLANELERLFRRRGSALCSRLHQQRTLFSLWPRAFGPLPFGGSYYQDSGTDPATGRPRPGTWVDTGIALTAADKQLLASQLLENRWRGDVDLDLAARYCPQPTQSPMLR